MINVDTARSTPTAEAHTPRPSVVGVLAPPGRRHRQAQCGCGWDGPRRRMLPKTAVVDALTHALMRGCAPAYPLVRPGGSPESWPADDGTR